MVNETKALCSLKIPQKKSDGYLSISTQKTPVYTTLNQNAYRQLNNTIIRSTIITSQQDSHLVTPLRPTLCVKRDELM